MTEVQPDPHHERDDDLDQASVPGLIRWARGTYSQAIQRELADAGIEDLPPNGAFVLGGLANRGEETENVLRGLGVSKQAVSQLLDTLVLRGFLLRSEDPQDRRRIALQVTERGLAAAAAVKRAVDGVDAALVQRIGLQGRRALAGGLVALGMIGQEAHPHPHG